MSSSWDSAPLPQAPCVLEGSGRAGTLVLVLTMLALLVLLGVTL